MAESVYLRSGERGHDHWTTRPGEDGFRHVLGPSLKAPQEASTATRIASEPREQRFKALADALAPLVARICAVHNVDPAWVLALIEVESGFDNNAVSPKGARGLMQLMPQTARDYGVQHVRELHQPERNLEIGVRHLKHLLTRNGGNWPLALSAYNAGEGAVARHGQRIPRYPETMLYVPAVLSRVETYRHLFPAPSTNPF